MKLTLTRGELKEAVGGFQKIVSGKPTPAILGYVRFTAAGGDLTAAATDLDQSAVYRFDNAGADGEGEVLVPLTLLRELSRGEGAEVVTFESAGTSLTITNNVGGHAVRHMAEGADPAEWPPSAPDILTTAATGFLAAYRRMAPFASTDETRRVLQGVFIDVSGTGEHNATLVATDGRRLTCCNSLKLPVGKDGVIVPVTRFLLWNGLHEEAQLGMSAAMDCTRICVRAGKWTYRVKAVDGTYPNWRQVIPAAADMPHRITFTDADAQALRKILPALPGDEAVALEGLADGGLGIGAADKESGRRLSVPLTAGSSYAGPGSNVILNRNYLLEALAAGFRNFLFTGDRAPLRADDGEGGIHVLMPLRFEGEAPYTQPAEPEKEPATPQPAASTETSQAAAVPQPVSKTNPNPKEAKTMTNTTQTEVQEATALERLQTAYETAKGKVREAQAALTDVASAIRDAAREDRQRRAEIESVRTGLQKLQSIRV